MAAQGTDLSPDAVTAIRKLSRRGTDMSDIDAGYASKLASFHEQDHEENYDGRKIVLGICAMGRKVNAKPMNEIISRLRCFRCIEVQVFPEKTILEDSIENWPLCDSLISFHSTGFPLDKAVEYAKLREPFVINDLKLQYKLMNRLTVHKILEEQGIAQPTYAVMDRSTSSPKKNELIEHEDHIEVNGVVFQKPFVEKPLSAEDHNIYIYYPSTAGGGSQRLFRKIGSRSSVYSPVSRVRTAGSYIYEEFMPTDGTDVKVYTVGPEYAHAEARKSPALDGKVERDHNGKEVRYPVILSASEKLISRKVCLAFKQTVCGFDLLRAHDKSYVCDVNGFSFVKTSSKYYDDCATVLGTTILMQLAPQLSLPIPPSVINPEVPPIVPTTFGEMMELRCVIAVIRHGDRTPKQKMKMEVRHSKFFDLFEKYGGYRTGQLKLKHPKQLQEVLDIARFLLSELSRTNGPTLEEKKNKLIQLRTVLEMYGYFSGINRKIQFKYQPHGFTASSTNGGEQQPSEQSLVLILKWGGELTPAGQLQAEKLGKAFRCVYPSYGDVPGLGFLRLHSTYRHDLKIYASDEGRVQMTAAAFTKGLLALEGELTPILVQMVKSGTHTNGLLDSSDLAEPCQRRIKKYLQTALNLDRTLTDEEKQQLNPCGEISLTAALGYIDNPYQVNFLVHTFLQNVVSHVKKMKNNPKHCDMKLYHSENLELMLRRWSKLEKDFKLKNGQFDISKIPDIFDCIKYDIQHNQSSVELPKAEELYTISKFLADIVIPQEYGLNKEDKLNIAKSIATPLILKIKSDLLTNAQESSTRLDSRFSMGVSSPDRHVRTRLYFTSESHIHSLVSLLKHGGLSDVKNDSEWKKAMDYVSAVPELNYMSQIVVMMYEDPNKGDSDERFHVEIHFSPGAYTLTDTTNDGHPVGMGYRPSRTTHNSPMASRETLNVDPPHPPVVTVPDIFEENDDEDTDDEEYEECRFEENKQETVLSVYDAKGLPEEGAVEGKDQEETSPLNGGSLPISVGSLTAEKPDFRRFGKKQEQNKETTVKQRLSESFDETISGGCAGNGMVPYQQVFRSQSIGAHDRAIRQQLAYNQSPTSNLGGTVVSALISTKVISGSKSAPNLQEMDGSRAVEAYGLAVPEIRPLETLHNALTLHQFDDFLTHSTDGTHISSPPRKRTDHDNQSKNQCHHFDEQGNRFDGGRCRDCVLVTVAGPVIGSTIGGTPLSAANSEQDPMLLYATPHFPPSIPVPILGKQLSTGLTISAAANYHSSEPSSAKSETETGGLSTSTGSSLNVRDRQSL